MPFKKGEISNPNGKKPGTLNKSTQENNARIDKVLGMLDKTIEKDVKELKGEERIKTWLELTEYRNTKLARTIISNDPDNPFETGLTDDQLTTYIRELLRPTNGQAKEITKSTS